MIDDLRAIAIFAKTVELGSFRGAATLLDLSPSVVSHHISQLEERLGVVLLYRSTRRLSLTRDGEKLYESAQAMLGAAEQGLNAIAHRSADPSGKLSVTVPAVLARGKLIKYIASFALQFPKIALSINFSDIQRDLIQEGFDVAIRIGELRDSTLKSKQLFTIESTLVAAPTVVGRHGTPNHPEDLADWDWIGLTMRPSHKLLESKQGEITKIEYEPRIMADSIDAVCQLAIAGLGLATPPTFLVEDEIDSGCLVEVLQAWTVDTLGVFAVWPPNAPRDSLTMRFIHFLEASEGR
ncbi:MAG: LysR family transcriptional regulator [Exilibacterium sp.]